MADLRRQGWTFDQVGVELECSERTARRYAGNVRPQIELPGARPEPDVDPDVLREGLARRFAAFLQGGWDLWPSVAFVNEANRQLGERLGATDDQTLRLLRRDARMREDFLLQILAPLYRDFSARKGLHERLPGMGFHDPGLFVWVPPRERRDEPPDEGEPAG